MLMLVSVEAQSLLKHIVCGATQTCILRFQVLCFARGKSNSRETNEVAPTGLGMQAVHTRNSTKPYVHTNVCMYLHTSTA